MIIAKIISILSLLFVLSCAGNNEKNLAELDKVFGKCDNPHREFSDIQYRICKDKERAAGGEPIDIEQSFTKILGNFQGGNVVYQTPINQHLWNGALETTKQYPLKIADNQGGYIETDWIYQSNLENQRCSIKLFITTAELISTGIKTSFICQNKINDNWINDGKNYSQEEKQITLKILENASLSTQETL